jgi:FkbM family methyltransferase
MKDGLGAALFYQGFTEPDIEDFLVRFLKPGMTFVDVGAHVGKYTLLGAAAVGPGGTVIAFEPNVEARRLLGMNIHVNGFDNVRVLELAAADAPGPRDFEVCAESTVSSLAGSEGPFPRRSSSRIVRVESTTLDAAMAHSGGKADLIKVDVEGAELPVLRGAGSLLRLPVVRAPVFIIECEPDNYARFGYGVEQLFGFLEKHGYTEYYSHGREGLVRADPRRIPAGVNNLIAAKEGAWLPTSE